MNPKKLYLELSENEASYLKVVMIHYRRIQQIMEKNQDKEYAPIINKLTNIKMVFEGKDPI